jgi:hypothetical protein
MPGKKIQTMKKRRTKYKKTRKGKKSGGGSTGKRKKLNRKTKEERDKENQQKLKVALASLDSYLNKAEKSAEQKEITRIQNRIKQLKESLVRNEGLLPKKAIVRNPSSIYGFPDDLSSKYGFTDGGADYEPVTNIGPESGSYAKPNNNVKKLVKRYNEFGLNKKSTGNYDRLNSKRKRMSIRK